jgi:hypothetical protein
MPTTYAIPNGSTAFAATLYTGNSSTQSVSNAVNGTSFQPDFVWSKCRNVGRSHRLDDSIRGSNVDMYSDTTAAEASDGSITAFTSTGFNINNATGSAYNTSGETYVSWMWKANGTAVTNTAGSITSQVSANTAAGFSVVTYTGTGVAATVGHGLGVAPSMYIVKNRVGTAGYSDWYVYHKTLGAGAYLFLNQTVATQSSIVAWNNTNPTSSVFSIGAASGGNYPSANYVAYCFAAVPGYSAFGSYTGNGSSDGVFVYTGFRPRFLLIKRTDNTGDWWMYDTSRSASNTASLVLYANSSAAEISDSNVDILSNGFKLRSATYQPNTSGGNFVYAAFAETPFKFANAR